MQNHNDDTIKTSGHSSLEKYTSHFIERVVCERELETEQNCNILTPTLLATTAFLSRSPRLLNWGPVGPASLGTGFLYRILSPTRLIPNCSIGGLRAPPAGYWLSQSHLASNLSDPQMITSGAWWLPLLGAGFLYRILFPTRMIPNWLIGGLRAPSAGCWLSLPHLVSNWLNFLCTELYNSSTSTFFLWASQIALIQPIHGQGYTLLFLDRMHLLFTQVHLLFWQPGRVVGIYTTLMWTCFFRKVKMFRQA